MSHRSLGLPIRYYHPPQRLIVFVRRIREDMHLAFWISKSSCNLMVEKVDKRCVAPLEKMSRMR